MTPHELEREARHLRHLIYLAALGLLFVFLHAASMGCATAALCVREWHTDTEVTHSVMWGPSIGQTVGVSGYLTKAGCEE